MPQRPPIPPGPPTPTGSGGPSGSRPIPGAPPKDDDEKRSIPDSLAGYGFDKKAVRAIIERYFRVYEERDALPGFERALLVAFYVLADKEDIEKHLGELHEELTDLDPQIQPMLREEGGETLIVVARRPREARETGSNSLAVALGLITLVTLTLAGSTFWMSFHGEHRLLAMFQVDNLLGGLLTFAVPLLFYFGVQETARRFVAMRYRFRLRPSLLIPVPPVLFVPPIATFGGLTNPRTPPPNRKALFDTAAAGPLAGFLAAVVIVIIGFSLTQSAAVPAPDDVELQMVVDPPGREAWREGEAGVFDPFDRSVPEDANFAHNITVTFQVDTAGRDYGREGWRIDVVPVGTGRNGVDYTLQWEALGNADRVRASNTTTGTVENNGNHTISFDLPPDTEALRAVLEYRVPDRTSVPLGEPIVFTLLSGTILGTNGDDLLLHPTGVAGWTAFLITGITLLPVGRYDGGGIARALMGDRMTILGYITLGALAVLTLFYAAWVYLLLVIVLFLSVRHPTSLDDTTPLDPNRQVFTVVLVIVFILCFVPFPSPMEGLGFLR